MVFLDFHGIGEDLEAERFVVIEQLVVRFIVIPDRFFKVVAERWRFAMDNITGESKISRWLFSRECPQE